MNTRLIEDGSGFRDLMRTLRGFLNTFNVVSDSTLSHFAWNSPDHLFPPAIQSWKFARLDWFVWGIKELTLRVNPLGVVHLTDLRPVAAAARLFSERFSPAEELEN